MDIKSAVIACLTEKHLGLSKQEILKIMDDEFEKPEKEIDCEIIDMCIELLAEIEHIKLPDDTSIPPAPSITHLVRKKKNTLTTQKGVPT